MEEPAEPSVCDVSSQPISIGFDLVRSPYCSFTESLRHSCFTSSAGAAFIEALKCRKKEKKKGWLSPAMRI
eukprot:6307442-Prorocentrum_lima.AAC.1